MRLNTLALSLVLLTAVQAQVTITDNEMPHAGDDLYRTRANLNLFMDYASTGPDHIWDFSNLTAAGEDLAAYQTVSSTNFIYALAYIDFALNPNRANHARTGTDLPFNELLPIEDPYTFFYRSSSIYKKVGYGVALAGIPVPIIYNEHDVVYNLPLNYGDQDASSSSYEVSIPTLAHYGYEQDRTNDVDGWGSITTPSGSFDVLRVHTTLAGRDTINLDSLGIGFAIDRPLVHEYKWLAEDLRVPILQVNTTELFGFEVISDIFFYDLPHTITVVPPLAATLCPGSEVDVNYVATGVYNEGNFFIDPNEFIVQLSDANGDFTNAVEIGFVEDVFSGVITVTIPVGTPLGTGYRIRVISTSPDFIGTDNGFDITISDEAPVATATANGPTTFCQPGSVTLSAVVNAGADYQWQLDGSDIAGATDADLEVTASGSYSVVVSNACGSDASDAISVTVGEAPEHTFDQATYLSCDGTPVTIITENVTGQSDLSYQWYLNGIELSGSDTQNLLAAEAGDYTLEVTNTVTGCTFTAGPVTVFLDFVAAPGIDPQGPTAFCDGGSVNLDAVAPLGYNHQWYLDGNLIPGATDVFFVAESSGAYTLVVTTLLGCTSAPSEAVIVEEYPALQSPTITALDATTFCEGGSVTLDAGIASSYQWSMDGADLAGETDQLLVVTASGSYGVVIADDNGCSAAADASVDVVVNPLPDAPVITQSFDSLLATGTGAFQWYEDGNAIAGATDAVYLPTESGNYTVTVTDGNGCTSTSEVFVYISTSVVERSNGAISIHPNPSNGMFVIDLPAVKVGSVYEILDATGKVVKQGSLQASTTNMDLRACEAGMYFMRITSENMISTERIVID